MTASKQNTAASEEEVLIDIVIVLGVPGCRWQFGRHAQVMCPVVQREVSSLAQSPQYPRIVDSRGERSTPIDLRLTGLTMTLG